MKSLFKRIRHSFEFALDYPFYWYLRMGVCKWGGKTQSCSDDVSKNRSKEM